jgi:hypothetical protein
MQCHECAVAGTRQEAVALCKGCSAGLCLIHLREAANYFGAGGTSLGCGHQSWNPGLVGRREGRRSP